MQTYFQQMLRKPFQTKRKTQWKNAQKLLKHLTKWFVERGLMKKNDDNNFKNDKT